MKNPPDYPNTLPGVAVDWLYKRSPEACFEESSGIPMVPWFVVDFDPPGHFGDRGGQESALC